ncbi:MAG: stage III sporulation protein AF [Clostridiales bacterium]|uniref:stage III sporulation protein AF n=1 Tax=Terrisporobacter sp. TaxID=1965305 RepID=UPI002A47296A|nr:stage III sporulation protein AF [Terrisporobacter sp.]MDD5878441.1 stage III sporulation protein AF [Clostridiales bacterium]MDD7754996.1 stage III sporulation protein AF [Clostridiales bacterium]MDY4133811.1 stage III sporulation protein AF [Terrisporobacter sp.]MDY4735352.1 stage III sporulation protein AF [Terrisporobacter sp.]MDY6154412.1 stage III sporulation protein AF [Terrisporobacter sp.]
MLWLLKIKIREGYVIASIKEWIISIIVGAFIINIVDMILPDTKVKPYINLVCNFIFVFMIISPLVSFFSNNMSLEDTILKKMSDYSKMYVDSYNDLAGKTNNENLSKGYEDGLKSVLQLKLDEYGYELEDLKINGSEIETIKVKEKNSNKENKEDIQSNDQQREKEVFKSRNELNLKESKLKEDLIKVLDISIDDIEID